MNLTTACGWTLLRSVVIAAVVTLLAAIIHRQLARSSPRTRVTIWGLLLLPFITPPLLTGYAYSSFSLSLIRHPFWNEVLYAALVGLRFLAVSVVVMHFAPPPPISAMAVHAARLILHGQHRWGRYGRLWPLIIRGPARNAFAAAAATFVFVFQEFEIASLMNITSWTVWVFDAQAGGLTLARTLEAMVFPTIVELLVVLLLVGWFLRSESTLMTSAPAAVGRSRGGSFLSWAMLICATGGVCGIPLLLTGRDALKGIVPVIQNRQMLREIGVAGLGGIAAGVSSLMLAVLLLSMSRRAEQPGTRRLARAAAWTLSLPGLLGSLVISLVVLWWFQRPVFRGAYDTLLPVLIALTVFLLPRALVMELVFESMTAESGRHLADQMKDSPDPTHRRAAGELRWHLKWRRHWLAAGILCLWGYLEMTPYSILAPPGLTAAPVRLYALMHYSRSNLLSAMTLLTMLVPIAAFLIAWSLRRPVMRVLRIC